MSSMETWAKLQLAGGTLKGGISGANKLLKKLGPGARMERAQKKLDRKQAKKEAKVKKEAHREWLRAHGSILQVMLDGISGGKKRNADKAEIHAKELRTAKIRAELFEEEKGKRKATWKMQKSKGRLCFPVKRRCFNTPIA